MLGAAHPVNFVGTQANTRSGARPFMRLAHTAKAFETIFFGTRAEADRVLAFVEKVHRRVAGELDDDIGPWPAGTAYTAFDPELMLWTVAVIADSAEAFYETFVGRLSPADKDALWRDYLRFGELFGMSLDSAPATYDAFRAYWEEVWTGGAAGAHGRGARRGASDRLPDPDAALPAPLAGGPQPRPRRHPPGTGAAHVRDPLHPRLCELVFRSVVAGMRAVRPLTPERGAAATTPRRSRWWSGPSATSSPRAARRCRPPPRPSSPR